MSLTRIGSIGINTGIAFAGVTTIVTLNTANDALSIGATVNVGSGITLGASGDIFATGVSTFSGNLKVGSGVTISPDGDGFFTGVITATSYSGIDLSDVTGATGDFSIADKIIHTGDTDTAIRFPSADTVTVEAGGSERLRIDSSGRLLLGTTTEGQANADNFTIDGGDAETGITIRSGTSRGNHIYFSDGTSGDDEYRGIISYQHSDNKMQFFTNATERARIDSSGRVLIGTTTEGAGSGDDLTISNSGNMGLTLRSTDSNYCNIYFSDATSGTAEYAGYVSYQHSTDSLQIATSSTERFRIDSDGKLSTGGENSPDVIAGGLCLNTGSADGIFFSCKNSDIAHGRTSLDETDTLFSVRKISADKGGNEMRGYTDAAGADPAIRIFGIIDDGTDATYCPVEIRGARKNTGGNTGTSSMSAGIPVVRISNDGDFTVATFTGEGLCFHNDTAAANALDDYEEGTWTPALSNGTGITVHTATYTKVGRKVNIHAYVTLNSNSSSGTLVFTGLPFNEANLNYSLGAAYTQSTGSIHVFNQIAKNGNYTEVLKNAGASILQSDMSGSYVLFSNTYFTT